MSIQARRMQEGKGELKVEFRSPEPENVSALPLVNLKHILILHFAREIIKYCFLLNLTEHDISTADKTKILILL